MALVDVRLIQFPLRFFNIYPVGARVDSSNLGSL